MSSPVLRVRDLAVQRPAAARVFEQLGIDYCCGGQMPLAEACAERALNVNEVLAAIEQASANLQPQDRDWAAEPLSTLSTHIVDHHHAHERRELERLRGLADRVFARHGDTRPELDRLRSLLATLADELLPHFRREELMLFPYIAGLERSRESADTPPPTAAFGSVQQPIRAMMAEHDAADEVMKEMHALSSGFTPPAGACPTFQAYYAALAEFETDLHRHVHLENNILFPRALTLEDR